MELRKEFLTLVQLMSLLLLFYWTATWNLPPNFDLIGNSTRETRVGRGSRKLEVLYPEGFPEDKHSIVLESFKSVKSDAYKALRISATSRTLPPFDRWKEKELLKQEKDLHRKSESHSYRKRKLNYASVKCGAKILSSNPEASYRMSILNEKIDEYMLNPCHVNRTWFVIELCDTIEATQIELANYELFSSSPKKFSSYWSDAYPTQRWHLLGMFEAKDQRSAQTFDLEAKNLGKFIKVVVSSYYGKEHFCLLSVFRVLGYSMMYEFDAVGNYEEESVPKNSEDSKEKEKKTSSSRPQPKTFDKASRSQTRSSMLNNTLAHNSRDLSFSKSNVCLNEPACLFTNHFAGFNSKGKDAMECLSTHKHGTFSRTGQCPLNQTKGNPRCNSIDYFLECIIAACSPRRFDSSLAMKQTSSAEVARAFSTKNEEALETIVSESAALNQRESVLTKLAHRMKASEVSLILMNRYLQQLSESYGQQMRDMQIMFNGTMKAISLASEKAAAIDEQQQASIEFLEQRVDSLNQRVEYFASGHEHFLKQLMELHGLFLILEFIVLTTLFSVFVNYLKGMNSIFEKSNGDLSKLNHLTIFARTQKKKEQEAFFRFN